MAATLRFHGHACFSLEAGDAILLLDPYEPGALGGAVALPPLPDRFDFVACTHSHLDHAAVHTVPSAVVLEADTTVGPFTIERRTAFHDEFGGRLRGGTTDILRVTAEDLVIVHLGDLGERPAGELLDWLRSEPIDALIVPVGGYFTLSPLAAREVVAALRPRVAVPCHSADDGVRLSQLAPRSAFLGQTGWEERERLVLDADARGPAGESRTVVLRALPSVPPVGAPSSGREAPGGQRR